MAGEAFDAGVREALIKVAKVKLVKTLASRGKSTSKVKESPKTPGEVMGMGSITMKRGSSIQRVVPNQQPPKPARY